MSKILDYENWDDTKVSSILAGHRDYFDILKWAYREYQKDIVYACSFGAEGIVLIDLIYKVDKEASIKFLDTGLHFPETYQLIEKVRQRYPTLKIEMVTPRISLKEQAKQHGEELWKENPNLCCQLRKVAPLKEAISGAKAWITGLRREQSLSRSQTKYINKDDKFQKIKICPLIHWTWDEVLAYIALNKLPYNPLHDQGFPSIGCAPCTRPAQPGADSRSGRWAGLGKTECGLHHN
ncbi:phosphoadenylyl-sulfate reductase [Bacillus sp. FJAT-27251]|uniref:phosphoadenylyl-sulfate reductase n=1 Tax=Bacillus sp. FJAT-27251 TaxID=1684142 RepID=UPI000A906AB5|nr:phosphoadenylyl-sulfate reductase [Bacillus sp. FJAT-27251]